MYLDVDKFLDDGFGSYKTPSTVIKEFEIKTSMGATGLRTRTTIWNSKLCFLYEEFLSAGNDMILVDTLYPYINADIISGRVARVDWEVYTIDVHPVQLDARDKLKVMLKAARVLKQLDVNALPYPGDVLFAVPTGDTKFSRARLYRRLGLGAPKPNGHMYGYFDPSCNIKPL